MCERVTCMFPAKLMSNLTLSENCQHLLFVLLVNVSDQAEIETSKLTLKSTCSWISVTFPYLLQQESLQ